MAFFAAVLFLSLISCKNNPQAGSAENDAVNSFAETPKIEIYDSIALAVIDPDATIEILAKGFYWTEGPLWLDELQALVVSYRIAQA